jgi:hypothetical protein
MALVVSTNYEPVRFVGAQGVVVDYLVLTSIGSIALVAGCGIARECIVELTNGSREVDNCDGNQ